MVKPTVFALDPSEKKAQEKAKEAGQVEVPIPTDKLQNELNVQTREGARGGCCSYLKRREKIAIGVIATLILLGGIGYFTYHMVSNLGVWCGTDDSVPDPRWDEFNGGHGGGIHHPRPTKGGSGSHDSSEEHDHDRPGDSNDDDDHHHNRPHHGHGDGDSGHEDGSHEDGHHPGHHGEHGPHGTHGPHGPPGTHGPRPGLHPGPHPGPHPAPDEDEMDMEDM